MNPTRSHQLGREEPEESYGAGSGEVRRGPGDGAFGDPPGMESELSKGRERSP